MSVVDRAFRILNYAANVPSARVKATAQILAAARPSVTWLRQVDQLRSHLQHEGLTPETSDWMTPLPIPQATAAVRPALTGSLGTSDSGSSKVWAVLLGLAALGAVAWWAWKTDGHLGGPPPPPTRRRGRYTKVPGVLGAE